MSRENALNAAGHLCFECQRTIERDEMVTVNYLGLLPIYHHTSCIFGEDKTELIKIRATLMGDKFYEE